MALTYDFKAEDIINSGRVSKKDIEEIKIWSENEKLPKVSDERIIIFFIACENDIEATKSAIKAYYSCSACAPHIFNGRDINSKELATQVTLVLSCVIPKRTINNDLVIYQRLRNFSYWPFQLESSMKYLFMTLDTGLQNGPPPDGLIVLFDMKGFGIMHLTKFRLHPLRIFFRFLQEAIPCRIKQIHVFNATYFVDKLIALIKPLMKTELFDKLHFHLSSLNMGEFFENWVEADCIPSDYGGNLPPLTVLEEATLKKMNELTEWFDTEEAVRKNCKP